MSFSLFYNLQQFIMVINHTKITKIAVYYKFSTSSRVEMMLYCRKLKFSIDYSCSRLECHLFLPLIVYFYFSLPWAPYKKPYDDQHGHGSGTLCFTFGLLSVTIC